MQNLNEVLMEKFGDGVGIDWHLKEVSESIAKFLLENKDVTDLLAEKNKILFM